MMTNQGISATVFVATVTLTFGTACAADPTVSEILSALTPNRGALKGAAGGLVSLAPTEPVSASALPVHKKFIIAPGPETVQPPSLDLPIEFRLGSTDLTPRGTTTISKLGMALSNPRFARCHFRIEGHTGTVGTKTQNKTLSQALAEKVADILEHDFGISSERIQPVGMGESASPVSTPDQTNNVNVVNLGS